MSRSLLAPVWAVICDLVLALVCYALCRGVYLLENWQLLSGALAGDHAALLRGAWAFDASAIAYSCAPWLLLMLLPWHGKERPAFHRAMRWLFVAVNALAIVVNLCDAVYFPYTLRRTTSTVFGEFAREGNLAAIFAREALRHWYLVLAAVAMVWGLWKLYRAPRLDRARLVWWHYDLAMLASLAVAAPLTVAAMRGGFTTAVRPITVSNAAQYVGRPTDAALVLNTPFALLRTLGKDVFRVPPYYSSAAELEAVYTPLHVPPATDTLRRRNVVVLIVESFGREYIGALNRSLDAGRYRGYTPCVDSLIARSVTFTHSYCNGRKSIDGMPSILSSIPMFVEPFFLTPASMNTVSGLAGILAAEGWQTAFFHGAQNGSMGFQAFAQATGFGHYYGRTEYDADPRFGGEDDFDGTWAIWDDPFLQFYCAKMSEMREPFMTAVFTASSHHPFAIPPGTEALYPGGPLPIHRCIRYTDAALGHFFDVASRQPWYDNTIFVLTSDHTNMSDHPEYQTDLGGFASPIVLFDPSGELEPAMLDRVAQQIDILPTVLGLLHYPRPYVAFGIDVLATPAVDTWAVNYLGGVYQYVKHDLVLQWDGTRTVGLYALTDSLMQHNLSGHRPEQPGMEREVKAIIQQYMERMTQDRLTPAKQVAGK